MKINITLFFFILLFLVLLFEANNHFQSISFEQKLIGVDKIEFLLVKTKSKYSLVDKAIINEVIKSFVISEKVKKKQLDTLALLIFYRLNKKVSEVVVLNDTQKILYHKLPLENNLFLTNKENGDLITLMTKKLEIPDIENTLFH